jgi:hypothetical protein
VHQFNEQCSGVTTGLLYYKCIGTIGTRNSCPEASIDVQNMAIGVLVAVLVVLVIVLSEIARTPIELILGDTAAVLQTRTALAMMAQTTLVALLRYQLVMMLGDAPAAPALPPLPAVTPFSLICILQPAECIGMCVSRQG